MHTYIHRCPYCNMPAGDLRRIYIQSSNANKEKTYHDEIARLKKKLKKCEYNVIKPFNEAATCYNCES